MKTDDLAIKLNAIMQRHSVKDYQDIAEMINSGISLEEGLAAARQKFGPTFSITESLRALTYFGDGDLGTLKTAEIDTICDAAGKLSAGQ